MSSVRVLGLCGLVSAVLTAFAGVECGPNGSYCLVWAGTIMAGANAYCFFNGDNR